jgi:predicted nucleic acid-binding protein
MIVLDTNVLSEALRPAPAASVRRWMEAQQAESLFTTTICEAEILYGVALLRAAQIAAIARSRGAAVATRNIDDFAGCGIAVVSPWA